ncbi:MAG TPA: ATP-binding protein [Caulobacteraceae bacterium]|jgi:PAS domain S-box-containing protein|nr:ATP-binding protein [Caulobacteraceae bacterium]
MDGPKTASTWRRVPVIAAASIAGLLLVAILVTVHNEQAYRADKQSEAQAQAQVVAASVTAALAFDDRAAANEYLSALRANGQVEAAAVYDALGGLAASYSRDRSATFPKTAPDPKASRREPYLLVVAPVVQASTKLGTVYLRTEAEPFARRAVRYGWVALLALMGSVVAGVLAAAHATVGRANVELETRAADLHEIATRQRAILNSAMDAIVTLDPDGRIEMVNRAGERMFGYRLEEIVGENVERILDLGPDGEGGLIRRLATSREALVAGVAKELTARRADGGQFPVDLALGAMELQDGLHMVAMIRDISDRKRTERLKDEFVSTVSHELRTPLTSIAGSLGLLAGGAAGKLPPKGRRLIEIAHGNCRRLVRLINDILDIEKIESGQLSLRMASVGTAELVARSVEDLRGYADQLGVKMLLVVEAEDALVWGDPDRIVQVVTNLLSNALKFSPPHGVVQVVLASHAGLVRLTVRDHGPGIPEEFRGRIFSKFAQADSTDTRRIGGTGLGLAISKEIVDRHGGRLWFESEVGLGAAFHVDLPLAGVMPARSRPDDPVPASVSRRKAQA